MENEMTRKGFLTAAVAAGVAAVVPSTKAHAEETKDRTTNSLDKLDVTVDKNSDSFQGTAWVQEITPQTAATVPQIDTITSHSGLHMMNTPGYFAFTGWDETYNTATDYGFAYSNDRFVIKAQEAELVVNDISINGTQLADWVVEKSSTVDPNEGWVWRKYASGMAEAWIKQYTSQNINIAWGSLYRSDMVDKVTFPFSFISVPLVHRQFMPKTIEDQVAFVLPYGANRTDSTGWVFYANPVSDCILGGCLETYVRGRWK